MKKGKKKIRTQYTLVVKKCSCDLLLTIVHFIVIKHLLYYECTDKSNYHKRMIYVCALMNRELDAYTELIKFNRGVRCVADIKKLMCTIIPILLSILMLKVKKK